jgi:hypothetical protein
MRTGSPDRARPTLDEAFLSLTGPVDTSLVLKKPSARRLPSMRVVPITTRRGGSLQ